MINYLKNLIKSNTNESSKRFLSLYVVLFLVSYVVIRYTNSDNLVLVLIQLLSFVVGTLGIATYQQIKNKRNH